MKKRLTGVRVVCAIISIVATVVLLSLSVIIPHSDGRIALGLYVFAIVAGVIALGDSWLFYPQEQNKSASEGIFYSKYNYLLIESVNLLW